MARESEAIASASQNDHVSPRDRTEQPLACSDHSPGAPIVSRSGMLRHGLPRPSRRVGPHNRKASPRISKAAHLRSAFLSRRQATAKGALHKFVGSFFDTSGRGAQSAIPPAQSGTSIYSSQQVFSAHGSVPSLDVVYPGEFLFSDPHCQCAGSHDESTLRLSYLTGSFEEMCRPRIHSDSFSAVDNASSREAISEPVSCQGVVRSVSDVLFDSTEEFGSLLREDVGDETALPDSSSAPSETASNRTPWSSSMPTTNDLFQILRVKALILRHSNSTARKSLRLTPRSWHDAGNSIAPPASPASSRLPTEILLSIYNHLNAKDFNSARRTCRTWMMASLNKSLLMTMLKRGGWQSGNQEENEDMEKRPFAIGSSEEWILSRHLARQCALASQWTGNGLDARPAMVESTEVDFSELAHSCVSEEPRNSGLLFTPSICSKYLLVAKDTLIYIYSLKGDQLLPSTSVVCPRRVLAVSMNASEGRHAVAALLEGRMGMVCELRHGCSTTGLGLGAHVDDIHRAQTRVQPPNQTPSTPQGGLDATGHISPAELHSFPYAEEPDLDPFHSIELKAHNQGFSLRGTDDTRTHDRNLIAQTWNLCLRGPLRNLRPYAPPAQTMPMESSSTSTFYRHVCTADDPPRTVSICPQRRCVAFGCSAGIELHWIDALSGQSLSRWFPLTSPSDHLYFLSLRPDYESAKKLRLISSAAHPADDITSRRLLNNASLGSFWDSIGFGSRGRSRHCDHYHAVPLSDGHHVLFIDASTDRLTLGCDAPVGELTKLVRKVVLTPPEGDVVPQLYTAAAVMSSGARIVVAYGDTVMLYSVPPDVLALSRLEQVAGTVDIYKAPPFSADGDPDHWLNWWDEPAAADAGDGCGNGHPIWPISLSGTEIGRLSGICELAVQTEPDVVVWAFTQTSQCKTWRFDKNDSGIRSKQWVDGQGLLHELYSVDGTRDVIMQDASWLGADGIDVVGSADGWFEEGGDVVTWYEG